MHRENCSKTTGQVRYPELNLFCIIMKDGSQQTDYLFAVFMVLLALIMAIAIQASRAPQEEQAAKSQGAPNTSTTETTNATQKPSQPHPQATSTASHPPTHTNQSNGNSEEENVQVQRWIEIFTGVLAGVGVLQLVVMFLTWFIYRRQAHEMQRQRHEMVRQRAELSGQRTAMESQLEIMQAQLIQMKNSGEQTDQIIEATKKNVDAALLNAQSVINAERAWIDIDLSPVQAGASHYAFRVTNHGKSPAFVTEWLLGRAYWNGNIGDIPVGFTGHVTPERHPLDNLVPASWKPMSITNFDVRRYPPGEEGQIVTYHAHVCYRDIFSQEHRTELVCLFHRNSGYLEQLPRYTRYVTKTEKQGGHAN